MLWIRDCTHINPKAALDTGIETKTIYKENQTRSIKLCQFLFKQHVINTYRKVAVKIHKHGNDAELPRIFPRISMKPGYIHRNRAQKWKNIRWNQSFMRSWCSLFPKWSRVAFSPVAHDVTCHRESSYVRAGRRLDKCSPFLGAFAKLRETSISFVMSVTLDVHCLSC
jgi:hypothetical protein